MLCSGNNILRRRLASLACPPSRYCKDDAAFVNPELLSFPWRTGPDSLIEYPVPRSFQLVVVECLRRAIDGLSPL